MVRDVATAFGGGVFVTDWTRQHENFFRSIQLTRSIIFIILLLVVAVGAFYIKAANYSPFLPPAVASHHRAESGRSRALDHPSEPFVSRRTTDASASSTRGVAGRAAGARRVIACDLDPWARRATQLNAEVNGVELELLGNLDEMGQKVDLMVAADVLYDWDNLPLLQWFREVAGEVWLADSRVANFSEPGYQPVGEERAVTLPDLGESETVKNVRFYRAAGVERVVAAASD